MKFKILSINRQLNHRLITNATFADAPSFADFDVLIIDPKYLSNLWRDNANYASDGTFYLDTRADEGIGRELINLFQLRKQEVEKLLTVTQGIVICFVRNHEKPIKITHFPIGSTNILDIYSWLPQERFTWLEQEKNRSAIFPYSDCFKFKQRNKISYIDQSHAFSKYFHAFSDTIRFECILDFSSKLEDFISVISKNKVNEIISCEVPIGGGKLVFIPTNDSENSKKEIGVLLNCIDGILDVGIESPPPDWISNYSLPQENKNEDAISALSKKIKILEIKKRKLEKEQLEIVQYKGLLYLKGKRALEPLVRKAFRLIGFKVLEPEEYEENYDLLATENDITIIGEIEGKDNSPIDADKFRQLFDYAETESDKGVKVKGILIGNPFKDTKPPEREEAFTAFVIQRCERHGYCRITTHQIFKIVEDILLGIEPSKLKKIREGIIASNLEYIYKPNPD